MFRPSQDSSVWLSLTSREQLMPPECSKHQVLINNIYKTCKYNKYVCIYLSCDLLINITHSHIKMHGNFFCSIFLQFWAFYWCLLPFWEEITWKVDFISDIHASKNILVHLKKFCHFGTRLYCLWNTVFVEKNSTLVDYIFWCLIGSNISRTKNEERVL